MDASEGCASQRGWEAFAKDTVLGLSLVRRRVAEISVAVKDQAEGVAVGLMQSGFDGQVLSRIAEMVASRAERCALTVRD